jgi:AcrR family transcriptional regulator
VTITENSTLGFDVLGRHYDLPYDVAINPTKERLLIAATELFAMHGYTEVSMRDIADQLSITPGALYNHYSNKEMLWKAVLDQAASLYLLYFKHLEEEMCKAESFEALLDIIFLEPLKMSNTYTNYAFALIQAQQFRDKQAAQVFSGVFMGFGAKSLRSQFEAAIKQGFAQPFDTQTAAVAIIQSVMMAINATVQESLGTLVPFDATTQLIGIKQMILKLGRL